MRNEKGQASDAAVVGGIIAVVVGIILVSIFFLATVSVGTGQRAVMTRFGRVTGQEIGEGFHMKHIFDKANKYDIKVQKTDAQAEAASKDLQEVHARLVLNFSLEPGKVSEIHRTVGTSYPEKLIDPAIQEVFKASTAGYDATQLITERAVVKERAGTLLHDRLQKYGINVIDLSITNFSFSKDFTNAIEAKQVAQQNAEKARFALEASRTESEAQRIQSETLSEFVLRKQWIEKWDGKLPQTMTGDSSVLIGAK